MHGNAHLVLTAHTCLLSVAHAHLRSKCMYRTTYVGNYTSTLVYMLLLPGVDMSKMEKNIYEIGYRFIEVPLDGNASKSDKLLFNDIISNVTLPH